MTYIKSAFDVFYIRVQKSCKKKRNLINIDELSFARLNPHQAMKGLQRRKIGY